MRETISIQVGKCGILLGHEFWKKISVEHSINPDGSIAFQGFSKKRGTKSIFFRELSNGIYIPRTILFDLEPREIQTLKNGNYSKFYQEADIANTIEGSGNNWSSGYIRTLEINREIEENIRKNAEKCDSINNFSIFHSITGGTGSGSSCVLLEILREFFPGKIINCYSLIPNQIEQSDIVVQPYNSVLSMRWLYYYSDCVILFENESLNKIVQNENNVSEINYKELNSIVANIVSKFTLPLRFNDYIETNFDNTISSLIPFPNLHFLFGASSGHQTKGEKKLLEKIFPENTRQLLKNKTISSSWSSGKIISSLHLFKKKKELNINSKILKKIYQDAGIKSINWGSISIQEINLNLLGLSNKTFFNETGLFNHSGVNDIFIKMRNQFDILKKRNAFLNNFLKEFSERDGQEIFEESRESISKLISDYNNV